MVMPSFHLKKDHPVEDQGSLRTDAESNDDLTHACDHLFSNCQSVNEWMISWKNTWESSDTPVNTRLQVGLTQTKGLQHITASHTHLKMTLKWLFRIFCVFPHRQLQIHLLIIISPPVVNYFLIIIISPPVVLPTPLWPKPILGRPSLRCRRDSNLAWVKNKSKMLLFGNLLILIKNIKGEQKP